MVVPSSGEDGYSRRNRTEYESRKAASITNARALIEKQRKLGMLTQDKSLVEESEMRLNESSDEEYEEGYENKEYHLFEDVIEFKRKDLKTLYKSSSKGFKK